MPAMANITVKDAANADVVYNAAAPSAGDKTPAVWRANNLNGRIGWRPLFQLLTRDNSARTGRHFTATFKFPITDTVGGVETLLGTMPFTVDGTLPTNVDATRVNDAFIQLGNLLASTLVRAAAAEGYAPT